MKSNKRELDRNISIFGAFLVICICLGIIFYAFYRMGAVSYIEDESVDKPEDEIVNEKIVKIPGWKDVVFSKMGLSMQYPPEMELRENEDGSVSMVIIGPSQSLGTEIYDGLILNMSTNTYTGDFASFVKSEHAKNNNEEAISKVGELGERTVGNRKGYEFFIEGLGRFTLIYLPINENKYLQISYLLEDPKTQGFAMTLDKIFGTIRFE